VPASSGTILVTSFVFDNAGNQVQIIDAMGTVTYSGFDQAGRLVRRIENYIPLAPVAPDVNRTVAFGYNDDGNMVSQMVTNPATGNQFTQWAYGVNTGEGSAINSNALLYQKLYPDSSTPVTYLYNRQGQAISMADQAGTTHRYTYDLFGRLTADNAVTFGPGVDETVASIARGYKNARGHISTNNKEEKRTGSHLNKQRKTHGVTSQQTTMRLSVFAHFWRRAGMAEVAESRSS
jgi:YD repeat-containing protein